MKTLAKILLGIVLVIAILLALLFLSVIVIFLHELVVNTF